MELLALTAAPLKTAPERTSKPLFSRVTLPSVQIDRQTPNPGTTLLNTCSGKSSGAGVVLQSFFGLFRATFGPTPHTYHQPRLQQHLQQLDSKLLGNCIWIRKKSFIIFYLSQQANCLLRSGIGLRQNRDSRLLKNLRGSELSCFFRNISVS